MKSILTALFITLVLCSCTAAQKQEAQEAKDVAIECGRLEVQHAITDLMPVVLAILNGASVEWSKMLEGLASEMGENAIACTLDKLAAVHQPDVRVLRRSDPVPEPDVSASGKARAQSFLDLKGWEVK